MTGHDWSYCEDDHCGPTNWPGADGKHQSPIDIDVGKVERHESTDPIKFVNYDRPISGKIVNNGHSVQMTPESGTEFPEIYGSGLDQVYRLIQYHFHWGGHDNEGSEHRLGGLQYAAELHLVHQGVEDPSKLAVIGVFLKAGNDGTTLRNESEVLEKLVDPEAVANITNVVLADKLPKNKRSFWRYEGSLTTPPCSEVVTWTLFTQAAEVTHEQLELFRQVKDHTQKPLKKNFRPCQAVNGRKVLHIVAN